MNENNQTTPNDHRYYPEDEIELMDYFRVLWNWKILIVLMAVCCSLAAAGYTIVKYRPEYVTECTVKLNFQGIDKGQNPDGSRFDKNQIIAPHILRKVVDSLTLNNKEYPLKNIRELIIVNAVQAPNLQDMRKAAESRGEIFTYFPNRFKLSLTTKNKHILSEEEKSQILPAIIDEFRKGFNRKYGEEALVVVDFPDEFLSKYDYIEIINIFKLRVSNLVKLLDFKIKKAGFFKSKKNSLSFSDIRYDSQIIMDVEITGAEAIIKNLILTRDKNLLIGKYKNQLRELELKISKKESEGLVARKLLKEMRQQERYSVSSSKEKSGTSVVLDSSFIQNLRQNDYYSLLLKTAMGAGIEAGNLQAEKKYLEHEIVRLKDKNSDQSGKNANIDENAVIENIHTALAKIKNGIVNLSQITNELNREYLEYIIDGAVNITESPINRILRTKSLRKIIVLSGIVGLFFSIFSAFFLEYLTRAKDKE